MIVSIPILEDDLNKLIFCLNRYRAGGLRNRLSEKIVYADPRGFDAVSAFVLEEELGEPVKTKHPRVLQALNNAVISLEAHLDKVAYDQANGLLSFNDVLDIVRKNNYPKWTARIIHRFKMKYTRETY